VGKPVAGDVVVLPFPQTNLQTGKRRPALVVADLSGDDLILCQITTQARSDVYSVPLVATDFERVLRGAAKRRRLLRTNRCIAAFKEEFGSPEEALSFRGPSRSLS